MVWCMPHAQIPHECFPIHVFIHTADTKKLRDACVVQFGEDKCRKEIEAHNVCLRADGFDL
jgi:hypothetical protein